VGELGPAGGVQVDLCQRRGIALHIGEKPSLSTTLEPDGAGLGRHSSSGSGMSAKRASSGRSRHGARSRARRGRSLSPVCHPIRR
jgi:hypothetical protein